MDSEQFEKIPLNRLILKCALPSMISMAFGSLYMVVDGIFVGKFIGEDALAAVNLIMPYLMLFFAIPNLIATGASAKIGILLGEKKREQASRVFSFTLLIIELIAIIACILSGLFSGPIIRLVCFNATKEAIQNASAYFLVNALFFPFMCVFFATDNYLRVCGKEKTSMFLSVLTQILNILLDFIFVVLLRLGVWSTALASCISISLGSVISAMSFRNKKLDLYFAKPKIALKEFIIIVYNGSSEFLSGISFSIMAVVQNILLLKYGGITAVAVMSILMYIDSIVGGLLFGLCDSLQPALSYCFGAGKHKRVTGIEKRLWCYAFLISVCSFLFLRFLGEHLILLMIKDSDLQLFDTSKNAMHIFAFSYFVGWVGLCLSSFFTALECPKESLILSVSGALLIPTITMLLLCRFFALDGIWYSSILSGILSAGLAVFLLQKTPKLRFFFSGKTSFV